MRLTLLILLPCAFSLAAQASVCERSALPIPTTLSASHLEPGVKRVFKFEHWRFAHGDNPEWADPEFDDHEWFHTSGRFLYKDFPGQEWTGVGWFRTRFATAVSLESQRVSMALTTGGAAEVYLDGKLVHTIGRIGRSIETEEIRIVQTVRPFSLPTLEAGEHVLAVRYSIHNVRNYREGRRLFGIHAVIGSEDVLACLARTETNTILYLQFIFTALTGTFGIFHLLIFAFHPSNRRNLYYALFAIGIMLLTYSIFNFARMSTHEGHYQTLILFRLAAVITSVFALRFAYSILGDRLPWPFWIGLAGGAAVLAGLFSIPSQYVYALCLFALLESMRAYVLAIRRGVDGAWIIAFGMLAFTLASSIELLRDIGVIPRDFIDVPYLFVYGVGTLIVSMSVYLSRQIARTNSELKQRLIEVKQLSEQAVEQERLAKEQEMRQRLLEAEHRRQQQVIEDAERLREVMDELEIAHRELRSTQTHLAQTEKMAAMGMLIAGVAHEINTPVAAVNSMQGTLLCAVAKLKDVLSQMRPAGKAADDAKVSSAFRVIDQAGEVIASGAERVAGVVQRLRSFARLDRMEMKKVNVHERIEETIALAHHELKDRVTVRRDFGDLPEVLCFPGQLNQVLLNLFVNARQAMEEGGEITIRTRSEGDRVRIEISDTGSGIPPEHLDRIFDPGFTTRGVGVGTGLGLSIVYRIIENHKGKISVKSTVGKGTTFTILLPVDMTHE